MILTDAYMITPNVKHFIFHAQYVTPFDYIPGQFITIHFEKDNVALKRSYSIANAPEQNNQIEFAAGFVEKGPGTDLLFNLKPGDELTASGPYGRLILKDEVPKRYVLVATSTGVTPYRAMITELKKRLEDNPALQVSILQGVQTLSDVLYSNDFKALAQEFPQVSFQVHLSRQTQAELGKHEYAGYVQQGFADLALNPAEDLIYLCGNPAMIDEAFEQLKLQGFTTQHIIREKYISGRS